MDPITAAKPTAKSILAIKLTCGRDRRTVLGTAWRQSCYGLPASIWDSNDIRTFYSRTSTCVPQYPARSARQRWSTEPQRNTDLGNRAIAQYVRLPQRYIPRCRKRYHNACQCLQSWIGTHYSSTHGRTWTNCLRSGSSCADGKSYTSVVLTTQPIFNVRTPVSADPSRTQVFPVHYLSRHNFLPVYPREAQLS